MQNDSGDLDVAEAMICTLTENIDAEVLNAASRLRVIANYAVGFNNVAVNEANARGIVVTNTPDVLTEATADLTWALLLAVARRLVEGHSLVQPGGWQGWEDARDIGSRADGDDVNTFWAVTKSTKPFPSTSPTLTPLVNFLIPCSAKLVRKEAGATTNTFLALPCSRSLALWSSSLAPCATA